MKTAVVLLLAILLIPAVFAADRTCTRTVDPPRLEDSVRLCADNYYPHNYPQGIEIVADDITLDCGTAVLHGAFKNSGIVIQGRRGVTIKNCQIANYDTGILIRQSKDIKIIDSKLIRNHIGIKIIDSSQVVVEHSHDISIKKPVQAINSYDNTFHYLNKNLEGDLCRLNQCNLPTGIAVREYQLAKEEEPKKFLRRILNDAIRLWLAA